MVDKKLKYIPLSKNENNNFRPITIIQKNIKKCERSNHIPKPTPKHININEWYETYEIQLYKIYNIIKYILSTKYKINWEDPKIFKNLISLIFNCSSKYISPYVKDTNNIES